MGAIFSNLIWVKDMKLTDQVIANLTDMTIKGATNAYLAATLNAVTPEVGRLCAEYLNEKLMAHEALTALIVKKNWAKPYLSPEEQLSLAYRQSEWVLNQREAQA